MMLSSSYKIPGGKLVKVKLWVSSERIERVTVLGDFFLHPEETIDTIEKLLVGLEFETDSLLRAILNAMRINGSTMIGATAEDIVKAIMMAWDSR
ncbi:MAG: lipoate protein ligase C-terminal domain-containing protein [Candidatus Thorarchaeota archaeon]